MIKKEIFNKFIKIDGYSATPKYLQLRDSIIDAVENGKLKRDDILPSINELSYLLEISRDTAEKGYKYLKKLGVIISVPGKGYYISNIEFKKNIRVCLLFNKLSAHKKIIYDAFVDALGEQAFVDFYIYNNDFAIFKKLLQNKQNGYSHYVIIPHFVEGGEKAYEIINAIPKEKLVLLDKKVPGVDGQYAAIYENFEKDIYNALNKVRSELEKYHTIKIVFPKKSYYPKEILKGLKLFCQQYAFNYAVVNDIEKEPIEEGQLFITVMEDDLVYLLEKINSLNFKLGQDVGLISYNETPLKKLLLNGITTISTDFKMMGTMAAETVLTNCLDHHEVPFYITLRPSV
ncbi:MAG TPA: GntR family transcriptional regulator [Sphingobacteriaceae bacterium]|nr:GntR family transcriptional regulator [Sphingobacteriaceae bacterium]